MVSSAGVTVAKGPCHLLNTFSIIQITKSAGVKIKVNIAHPTHHLEGRLKQGELKYKKPTCFLFYSKQSFCFSLHHQQHPTNQTKHNIIRSRSSSRSSSSSISSNSSSSSSSRSSNSSSSRSGLDDKWVEMIRCDDRPRQKNELYAARQRPPYITYHSTFNP